MGQDEPTPENLTHLQARTQLLSSIVISLLRESRLAYLDGQLVANLIQALKEPI